MKWTAEPESTFHVDQNADLKTAYVEFWRRILTDALSYTGTEKWSSLNFDILDIQSQEEVDEDDAVGYLHAEFLNTIERPIEGLCNYYLKSRQYDFFYLDNENVKSYKARELPWFLEHYQMLKDAAQTNEIQTLWVNLFDKQAFTVRLATINDWFDMQIESPDFGPLPQADQVLLGLSSQQSPAHPLAHLMPAGMQTFALVEELSQALIQYTPPHFKTIHFQAFEVVDNGIATILYQIDCPEHPDDGTNQVNESIKNATASLARAISNGGAFCHIRLRLTEQPDGQWQNSLELPLTAQSN